MPEKIKLILGTMTFGEQVFDDDVTQMVDCFFSKGYSEIDTAYVYNEGKSEELLGKSLTSYRREQYLIATKANPRVTGKLDEEAVLMQANESLKRLGTEYIDILYLHFPDSKTSIESALRGCAKLYYEGKIREIGLSNFPAWLVAESQNVCKKNRWITPSVYEGLYNPLSRNAERELIQAIDYYGMRFYAYNPLAGGLLTNKYSTKERKIKEGRFLNRPNYQKRYWKDSYFNAIEKIRGECIKNDVNIIDAVYQWLAFYSILDQKRGDGIILGVSKMAHLEENLLSLEKANIPEEVINTINESWEMCKVDAPEYFTFYCPQNK